MAFQLTNEAKVKADQIQKTPNLILEIDGVDYNFSFVPNEKTLRFDDGYFFDDLDLFFDTAVIDNKNLPYISTRGTSSSLTQQLNQEKDGTGSVSNIRISIVDINDEVSDLFEGLQMLGRKAKAYLSFQGLEHPQNSIRIFDGVIADFKAPSGSVDLVVDNPDSFKRQEIYPLTQVELRAPLNDSDTTILVDDTGDIIASQDALTTYIKIDDEVILVGNINSDSFTACTRAQLDTKAAAHDDESEVSSLYRFQENNPIDLALKVMLSGTGTFGSEIVYTFVDSAEGDIDNGIIFDVVNIQEKTGVVLGDTINISGSTSNDGSYTITDYGTLSNTQSYFVVDGPIVKEIDLQEAVTASFNSQYDTLPTGCKMRTDEVDIDRHLELISTFLASPPSVDFRAVETVQAKDFLEKQIYFPIGAYFLARKGRASVGYTAPAIFNKDSIVLNENNVVSASKITVARSTNKNFYNAITYRYDLSPRTDKFLKNRIRISGDSFNEIRSGNKTLTVDAAAYRASTGLEPFIDTVSRRFLDRYGLGARSFKVETTWKVGYNLEVGDSIIFDGTKLGVYDEKTGRKDTFERNVEIFNTSKSITTGRVTLQVVDTNFGVTGRYCSASPASNIISDGGNSTTRFKIERSFGTSEFDFESTKWSDYIGAEIQVHNYDYTQVSTSFLTGVDSTDVNFLTISPALSFTPANGFVIEFSNYNSNQLSIQKLAHGAFMPSIIISSGISDTQFTVPDGSVFFVDAVINIRNTSYSSVSNDLTVSDVSGNTITVSSSIGFTPNSSYRVEGVGFASDEGDSYLIY